MNLKIAIIGAGPAGLTAGYLLSKKIKNIDVFESSNSIGGLSKSIKLWNQTVDIGPHRYFSSDKRINDIWLEVVGDDYQMVNRLTRIYYKKKYYNYPLKPLNALKNLGIFQAFLCVLSYLYIKIFPLKENKSFQDWVTNKFGKRLFTIFFKTYSEKLWGISCHDLDSDFAAQRIKKLSLFEAIKNAFNNKKNTHKSLIDQFAYPNKGTGFVYEQMAKKLQENQGNIFLNKVVKKVLVKNDKAYAIAFDNGEVREYDHIISTMPLTNLVKNLPNVPKEILNATEKLKFRNTIIVYLNIDSENLFPDNWLYIHSNDLLMGRITNFRNWVPNLYGDEKTSICAIEYWCYKEDDFWQYDDNALIEIAKDEIKKTKLVGNATILNGHVHRISNCYPVYNKGYKENLNPIIDYLNTITGLYPIGRYGSFKYNNQDHSILMGLLVSENILNNKNYNLWDVNTDYDEYQEEHLITQE